MNKSKYYKSISEYIVVWGLTKKIQQGLLSRNGDGVETKIWIDIKICF